MLAAKQGTASRAETSILEAYVLMLEDETLRAAVESKIESAAICAEWALDLAVAEMAAVLRQSGDPYLAERSHDFEFVEDRLLRTMAGKQGQWCCQGWHAGRASRARSIAGRDRGPDQRARAGDRDRGRHAHQSHGDLGARAGDPGRGRRTEPAVTRWGTGDVIVVDGVHGKVAITPSEALIADTQRARGSLQRRGAAPP